MRQKEVILIGVRLQTDERARPVLQRDDSGKLVTVAKNVAPFDDLKWHRGVKEKDGKILCRTVVQQ